MSEVQANAFALIELPGRLSEYCRRANDQGYEAARAFLREDLR